MDTKAYRFFHDNAGGIVGESAMTAFTLAKAEAEFRALDGETLRFVTEYDEYPDVSWMDDSQLRDYRAGRTLMLFARLQSRTPECPHCGEYGEWVTVDSLGGIHVAREDDAYLRVIRAQMVSEFLAREGR